MWSVPSGHSSHTHTHTHTRTHTHTSLHGCGVPTSNPLCQAPLNPFRFSEMQEEMFLFCFFQFVLFLLFWELKKWMFFFFFCWFIVLILYSDFFCNVCFLRKRNKMYLDFKETKSILSNLFCLMVGAAIPSLLIPVIHSFFSPTCPSFHSHQLNGYCWYPCLFVGDFLLPTLVFPKWIHSKFCSTEVQSRLKAGSSVCKWRSFVC